MDTALELQCLIDRRREILEEVLNNLQGWDNTIESGIEIIESNQLYLSLISDINFELSKICHSIYYDEEYVNKLYLVMEELERLSGALKGERKKLLEEKQQLSKKDKVIKNYIKQFDEPIFIDKDVR